MQSCQKTLSTSIVLVGVMVGSVVGSFASDPTIGNAVLQGD